MGKVLSEFRRGWPGAVTRSKDDVIVSLKNADMNPIAFGAPVFLDAAAGGAVNFAAGETAAEQFIGFAVRVPDKTPDTYASGQNPPDTAGAWAPGNAADILVRGSVAVPVQTTGAKTGDKVYIRLSDKKLVTAAGESGTTVLLPNVTVRNARDSKGFCEVTVTKRNLI
ncbi:hypothetical protein JNO48_10325 [Clostridiales bacterium]|nr:hypothetical protein JNO48_10325 [Clostridiales bacterium]